MDSDDHRKLSMLFTFFVTIKLYLISIVTLEINYPPRRISIQSMVTTQSQQTVMNHYTLPHS